MKTLKYNYIRVIQQNFGYGWEDVSEYAATSQFNAIEMSDKLSPSGKKETLLNHDLREYKIACPGAGTKVISRKVLNPDFTQIDKYDLPAFWASALINDDYSGLEDRDEKDLDNWLAENKPGSCLDVSRDTEYSLFNGLLTEVAEYSFLTYPNRK